MPKEDRNVKYSHVEFEEGRSFFFDHVHIVWNEQISYHQSDDWEISYIITGSGTRVIGNVLETFTKGEIIILPPMMPHVWSFDEHVNDAQGKIENITIIFPDALLDKCAGSFPEAKVPVLRLKQLKDGMSLKGKTLPVVQKLMLSMIRQNHLEQLASLISIISHIASSEEMQVVGFREKQSRSALKLQEVYHFMINNYNRKILLTEVARHVGMNSSAFCTFFKREKGRSFFSALNEYRVKCSCMMLRDTNMSVAEICFAAGFNDIPYFNRTFKKFTGETPNAYRKTQFK